MRRDHTYEPAVHHSAAVHGLAALLLAVAWAGARAADDDPASLGALRSGIHECEGQDLDHEDLVVRSNLPLARLKLRKAELLLTPGKYDGPVEEAARWEIEQGLEALGRLRDGQVAYAGERSGFRWPFDLARMPAGGDGGPAYYEYGMDSDTDGSPQPFLVEVPPDYDPGEPWPLLVYLHGYHGSVDMISKWDTRTIADLAKQRGYLVVAPHGRSETDFLGVGEADVLQALREVRRYHNIDPERVYLTGGSMGGLGGLNLALHYPHEWAAVVANVATSDSLVFGGLPRDELLPFRRWHFLRNNPVDLAGNAPSLAIFGRYGGQDRWVPSEHGVRFADARSAFDGLYEYDIVPGGGHGVAEQFAEGLDWLEGRRRDPWPALVRHKTFSLRYDRSYWVRILGIDRWGEAAEIEARVEGNTIHVRTTNVSAYELAVDAPPIDPAKPMRVVSNGEPAFEGDGRNGAPIRIGEAAPQADSLRKTRDLCGPFDDLFRHPFLVVRGTVAEDPERRRRVMDDAEWFRRRWEAYTDGWPRMKDDVDVTKADIERYGLLLLGRPSENAITARVAHELPVSFLDDGFGVGEQAFEEQGLGLAMVYPNPLNPTRYVGVLAGERYGLGLPENHPFDQIPDLLVFSAERVATPEEGLSPVFGTPNRHIFAAFFDSDWRLPPRIGTLPVDTEAFGG